MVSGADRTRTGNSSACVTKNSLGSKTVLQYSINAAASSGVAVRNSTFFPLLDSNCFGGIELMGNVIVKSGWCSRRANGNSPPSQRLGGLSF